MNFKSYLAAAAVALAPVTASAASVDITFTAFGTGSAQDKADAISARDAFIGIAPIIAAETFDGRIACPALNCEASPLDTNVGEFVAITPAATPGSNDSQVSPSDQAVVRTTSPDPYGRYNVEGNEEKWLDSNDLTGVRWNIPGNSGLSNIVRLAFFLSDVDDVGQFDFDINAVNGDVTQQTVTAIPDSGQANANLQLVTMLFSAPINLVSVEMRNGLNDGFGMDGFKVAAVPLPAAGLLLLGGLGGLAALRRRRKAA